MRDEILDLKISIMDLAIYALVPLVCASFSTVNENVYPTWVSETHKQVKLFDIGACRNWDKYGRFRGEVRLICKGRLPIAWTYFERSDLLLRNYPGPVLQYSCAMSLIISYLRRNSVIS
jgi:hypothetical protein